MLKYFLMRLCGWRRICDETIKYGGSIIWLDGCAWVKRGQKRMQIRMEDGHGKD